MTITAKFAWILEAMDPDAPEFLAYLREHNIAMLSTGVVHCCAGGGEEMEFIATDRETLEAMYRECWNRDAGYDPSSDTTKPDEFAGIREIISRETRDREMAELLRRLPLNSFGDDMGQHDAAEFVDHAGEFFEVMQAAKKLLAEIEGQS